MTTWRRDRTGLDVLDAYAAYLAIPRSPAIASDERRPAWDGRAMPMWDRTDDMAHELAHWILATPDERRLVDYGWEWDWQFAPTEVTGPERIDPDAELRACVLGFALMIRSGYPSASMVNVWSDYGFLERAPRCDCGPDADCDHPFRPDGSTYRHRRAVQPHVTAFAEWLATR